MAPTIVAGYGDSAWEPYDGSLSARTIDLTGSGVAHGDLIVVFATTPTTSLGAGDDFGTLSVSEGGGGTSGAANGPGNAPGDLGFSRGGGFPPFPSGVPDAYYGHIGSCVWNGDGDGTLNAGFTSPPTGLTGEPGFCHVVIFRDANSGNVLPISAPQEPTVYVQDNTIPFEEGTFGQADGRWVNFLVYMGVRKLPGGADTGFVKEDFGGYTIYDQGTLGYSEIVEGDDWAVIDVPFSTIDPAQALITMLDGGVSEDSPSSDWSLIDFSDGDPSDPDPDPEEDIQTIQRCFFGGSLSVQVWDDPEYNPFPDPEPESGNSQTNPLHIPHKDYALGQSNIQLTPLAQHQYFTNLKRIESWADGLRCSGTVDNGDGTTTTNTPTDGKWKERQLHIPSKELFSSRHVRENYLAIERWANLICPPLHIPHKDWVLMGNPHQEQVNLLTIERWARDIGRCCEEVTQGGGG